MFLKATRFYSLAVEFNYVSLFFHLTFRRIIQDMKVNLQILFTIFCKYSVIEVSCGILHMKLYLLNSEAQQYNLLRALKYKNVRKQESQGEWIYWFMLKSKIYVLFEFNKTLRSPSQIYRLPLWVLILRTFLFSLVCFWRRLSL